MAKQTIFKLENGDIEFNDDGETKLYTYKGKPFDQLTEPELIEIRDDPQMKSFIGASILLAEALAKVFEEIKKTVAPIFNQIAQTIAAAEQEAAAEKAKAEKAKTDEKK